MENLEIQLIQWLSAHAPKGYMVSGAVSAPTDYSSIITVERLSGQRTHLVDVALIGIDVWGKRRATLAKTADLVADLLYQFEDEADGVGEVFLQSLGYLPYSGDELYPRYHLLVQITSSVGA